MLWSFFGEWGKSSAIHIYQWTVNAENSLKGLLLHQPTYEPNQKYIQEKPLKNLKKIYKIQKHLEPTWPSPFPINKLLSKKIIRKMWKRWRDAGGASKPFRDGQAPAGMDGRAQPNSSLIPRKIWFGSARVAGIIWGAAQPHPLVGWANPGGASPELQLWKR